MSPPPLAPGGGHHAAAVEHDVLPDQRPDHRRPPHGAPQRLGSLVVHELVRPVEETAGAKGVVYPCVLGEVEDHGAAERAVHAGHRHAADHVDEHLVPAEDALRIGACIAVDGDPEHDVVVLEVAGIVPGDHRRVAQRRDAVLPDAAPDDLVEPDQRLAHLVEIHREPRVDEAVERALEGGVAWMPGLGRIPHRTLPGAEVVAVLSAEFGRDEPQQGGGDRRVADEAYHVERHRQVGRLPGGLDQVHGVPHVAFLSGNEGEERTRHLALADLRPRGRDTDQQNETESGEEGAEGGHRGAPNDLVWGEDLGTGPSNILSLAGLRNQKTTAIPDGIESAHCSDQVVGFDPDQGSPVRNETLISSYAPNTLPAGRCDRRPFDRGIADFRAQSAAIGTMGVWEADDTAKPIHPAVRRHGARLAWPPGPLLRVEHRHS